jgi:hypothetical protein
MLCESTQQLFTLALLLCCAAIAYGTCAPVQIKLGANRVLPLIRFRGAVRPVIIAGDRSYVERCIKEGERSKDALRQRGVSGEPCRPTH